MKFIITDNEGKILYRNLVRSKRVFGYDWNDNYGHVNDSDILINGWKVEEMKS